MALGTPTHLAANDPASSGTSAVTGSFTPTANALLIAIGAGRLTVAAPDPTMTGGGLTWTPIVMAKHDTGVGGSLRMVMRAFKAIAPASPVPMTATVSCANAGRCCVEVIEITGADANITNFDDDIDPTTGDPAIALPNAPAVGSALITAYIAASPTANVIPPATFTQIYEFVTDTSITYNSSYKSSSLAQNFSYACDVTILTLAVGLEVAAASTTTNLTSAAIASTTIVRAPTVSLPSGGGLNAPTQLGANNPASSGTSAVTGNFTPTANAMLIAFGVGRLSTTAPDPSLSGGGLTWSPIVMAKYDSAVGGSIRLVMRAFQATAPSSPASMAVTVSVPGAARCCVDVIEIIGANTSITNFDADTDPNTGDPAIALPNAPGAGSMLVSAFAGASGTALVTLPSGFAETYEFTTDSAIGFNSCYKTTSLAQNFSYSSNVVNPSVAVGFEITAAASIKTLAATAIASAVVLRAPTVVGGTAFLTATSVASTAALYGPTVAFPGGGGAAFDAEWVL